mgnify:CR=1 FL=1
MNYDELLFEPTESKKKSGKKDEDYYHYYPKTYHPKYEELLKIRIKEIINDYSSPLKPYLNITAIEQLLNSPENNVKPWYGQLMAKPQMFAYLIQIDYWMRKYSLSL